MIWAVERLLFGPPSPRCHPLAGWVCANCRAPLDTAESVHRHGGLLICGRCHR